MKVGLTKKQAEALAYIRAHIRAFDEPPSYSEIAIGIGCASKCNVHRLIACLEERGYIRRIPGKGRSITLTDKNHYSVTFPTDLDITLQRVAEAAKIKPQEIILRAVRDYIMEQQAA